MRPKMFIPCVPNDIKTLTVILYGDRLSLPSEVNPLMGESIHTSRQIDGKTWAKLKPYRLRTFKQCGSNHF